MTGTAPAPTRGSRQRIPAARRAAVAVVLAGMASAAGGAPGLDLHAQEAVADTLVVPRGSSVVVEHPWPLERVSIGDPDIADAVVVSDREVVVNGRRPGATTLLLWDEAGGRRVFRVQVAADVFALEQQLATLFPDEEIRVLTAGRSVVLEGTVRNSEVARKATLLAESLLDPDLALLDHLSVPDRGQILLQVRFAEVNRSALQEIGFNFLRLDPANVRGDDEAALNTGAATPPFGGGFLDGDGPEQTLSDAINFFVFHESSSVSAFIRALRSRGLFRSLAEPNLLAFPGEEASFLAGGEFPFPVVQGGGVGNAVTVEFREFGVRLDFSPTITNSGAIRLRVAPEVSSLDFGNAVEVAGSRIPVLLSRTAETVVELRDGQTFAIAGLIDSSQSRNVDKVPLLGDIPVLGTFFRSEETRENRTELLVLVTPRIVWAQEEAPALPTGKPESWGGYEESMDSIPPPRPEEGQPR